MDQQPSYPVNMTDHDLLIRVDQKLSQLSLDVVKATDGLVSRVSVLEAKAIGYDKTLAEYPPSKLVQMLMTHEKWISEFKITWKQTISLAIGLGSFITFILTAILGIFHIIVFSMPKH
jgi:hypothetical protein